MDPRRHQIGDGGHQYEEVADGLSLIERVRQNRDEQRRDHPAVPKPEDKHVDQHDIEQRQHIDEPPAIPPALIDHADQCIGDRGSAGDEHDGPESGLDRTAQPAEYPEHEQPGGDCPATAVTPLERFQVFEPLLEGGGFVVPAAHTFSKRGTT